MRPWLIATLGAIVNEHQSTICESLRNMSSDEAATWLINEYKVENENWGEALILIPHRSWSKNDQIRLVEHYLTKIPFASSSGYESFLSFMSVNNFAKTIQKYLPTSKPDKDLLKYYLLPLLNRHASTEKDKNIVKELKNQLL